MQTANIYMSKEVIENCPICGSDSEVVDKVPTIHPDAPDRVELRSCSSCGHWWHSPVPSQEELNKMYNSSSPFVVSAQAKESYQKKNRLDGFHKYILKRINQRPGNYLEIGAGGGGLLRRFRSMNYDCYGVDPGQWAEDSKIVASMEELPIDLRFDIIVLQDVLEHTVDPLGLMRRLKMRVGESSVFFCSFPCKDSRPARAYRGRWAMVRPYGHLHYFSFESARNMFVLAGMVVKDIRLARITSIPEMILSFNVRSLLYEVVKGGMDQIYAQVSVR